MAKGQRAWRRAREIWRPGVQVLAPPGGIRADWDVPVVMRDGVTLRVNVFRPEGAGPVPVVMSAHPYGKDRIPARTRSGRGLNIQYRAMPQPHPVRFSAWTSWEAPDPAFWVPRGYAVVNADLRGGGTSEGTGELFSGQEAQDYAELIEWAGSQPWSTGKVGLAGVSYLAISQYKAAALHPPHLAAICPWEGFTDLYRDFARPGGVLENGFSILWSGLTSRTARMRGSLRRELAARPERDGWYAARTPALADIEVPMLVCASFSDHDLHTRGSFEAFRRAGPARKWLYTHRGGKWSAFYGPEASQAQQRFFGWALKGEDNGWDATPPVRLAIHDHGPDPAEVRHEQAWPPDDLTWTACRLDLAAGLLVRPGPDAPRPAAGSTAAAGQRALDLRGDGVALDLAVTEDTDVIGPMAVRLFVQARDTADAHLFAGIRKLRGGTELTFEGSYGFSGDMVTHGCQRAAFRDLDAALSGPAQPVHTCRGPRPLVPGEIIPVDIALLPQATRFLAGDVLRLHIRGTWFFPRNPVTGQFPAGYAPSPAGTLMLHSGPERPATLLFGWRLPAGGTAS